MQVYDVSVKDAEGNATKLFEWFGGQGHRIGDFILISSKQHQLNSYLLAISNQKDGSVTWDLDLFEMDAKAPWITMSQPALLNSFTKDEMLSLTLRPESFIWISAEHNAKHLKMCSYQERFDAVTKSCLSCPTGFGTFTVQQATCLSQEELKNHSSVIANKVAALLPPSDSTIQDKQQTTVIPKTGVEAQLAETPDHRWLIAFIVLAGVVFAFALAGILLCKYKQSPAKTPQTDDNQLPSSVRSN